MEWMLHGTFALFGIMGLCFVVVLLTNWLNRDVNNIRDGKGLIDRNGKPLLGTEAINSQNFAARTAGLGYHRGIAGWVSRSLERENKAPDQSGQE